MTTEYTFYTSTSPVEEPYSLLQSIEYSFTIINTGSETGTDLGFYLKTASSVGDFDYPSIDSPSTNFNEILSQGDNGYGLVLKQGLTSTIIKTGVGDSSSTKIPLIIGTGDMLDELEPNGQIEITLSISFSPGTPSKSYYIDLELE